MADAQADMQPPARTGRSLALRLGLLAAGGSLAALLLAGALMAALQRAGAERAFDARLAVFLTQLFADHANRDVFDATAHFANPAFGLPGSGWYWVIADPDTGAPLLASASYFDPLPPPQTVGQDETADTAASTANGTANGTAMQSRPVALGDQRLRLVEQLFSLQGERVLVRVTAPTEGLDREIRSFQLALAFTLGAMWLALLVLAYIQVRVGLRPLEALQDAIAAVRGGGKERVHGTFPKEVSPLVEELNALLQAKEAVIERSRHHVGNLAHGLKTPLAVILNAARGPASETTQTKIASQAQAIEARIRIYLDRAQRAATSTTAGQSTAVGDVIGPLVRTMDKLNRDRDLSFQVKIEPHLHARTDRGDLEEMLGNLLENACRHAHGTVRVTARRDETRAGFMRLDVDDDGEGLDPAAMKTVLQRGRRLDETRPGSGLGLSIVLEMAELYDGSFTLHRSELGGLRATLHLPGAAVRPNS